MQHGSDTKGFGLVGILVIVVVLAVIGVAGTYVYHKDHKTKATASTSQTSSSSKSTTATNPYAGWNTYALGSTGLAFRYPAKWTVTDTPQSDGTESYAVKAPASELVGIGVSPVDEAVTSYEVGISSHANSSDQGIPLGAQSQSDIIDSGALKGKYVLVNGDAINGVSDIYVLNNSYQAGQKISETGTLNIDGKPYEVGGEFMAGQDIGDADTSSFLSSQLYTDTLNILNSFSTAN
jgi:Tfp pilus assembly major pilin PilA